MKDTGFEMCQPIRSIVCKEASILDAASFPYTPTLTFYKML